VMTQDVTLEDAEFKIEDVEEFPLNAADIPLAEDTRAERPVDVLKCGVVKVLARKHNCAKEHPFACPLLEGDVQMRLGSIDVNERSEYDGYSDFRSCNNVRNERREFGVSWTT
jgi:hypothetical protein